MTFVVQAINCSSFYGTALISANARKSILFHTTSDVVFVQRVMGHASMTKVLLRNAIEHSQRGKIARLAVEKA